MPIESNETQYRPLFRCWPRGDSLTVSFASGGLDLVVRLPLAFVSSSADPTHAFVEHIAQVLVEESGSLRRKSAPREVLEPGAAPSADEYIFVPGKCLRARLGGVWALVLTLEPHRCAGRLYRVARPSRQASHPGSAPDDRRRVVGEPFKPRLA